MKHIMLTLTVLMFLLTSITEIGYAQNTPNAVKQSLNSIVAIDIDNSQSKTFSRGLGFFVSDSQVVTHISNLKDYTPLPKGVDVYVKLVGKRIRYRINGISVPNKIYNLVLLNVSIPSANPLPISNKTHHSGTVYSVSDPSKPVLEKGIVKGNSKNGMYIRVSNEISQKNIGGPLLNSKGEVIGIFMEFTELNTGFVYDDGNLVISRGKSKDNMAIQITKSPSGIRISDNNIKIDGSSFAVSSNIIKKLIEFSKIDSDNSHLLGNKTEQRKSDSNRIEKTFDINAGGQLTIDTEIGDIDVQSVAQDVAKVIIIKDARNDLVFSQETLDDFKVTFNKKGPDLTIKGEFEKGRNYWLSQLHDLKIRFQVTVPQQYDVDLSTQSGDLSIEGVTGKVYTQSSAGDVIVKNVVGTVNTQTSSGDLRLVKVKGPIFGRSSAGDIALESCQGKVDVKTSSGDIRAETLTQPKQEWKLQSSDGDIVFVLPSILAATIDARTSAGKVSTDFLVQGNDIRKNRIRGTIKGGGKLLKLRTSAGDIRLKAGRN